MDTEKTLLQQIRDKEQEFAQNVEAARGKAENLVAAARTEAEDLLCTADKTGKEGAEQVYWKERAATEAGIAALHETAEREQKIAAEQAAKNLPAAAERIVRYVTME